LVLAAPTAALAASSNAIVRTNGTRAGEAWFNRSNGTHGNNAWFDLHDAKCDAEPVYVEYRFNGSSSSRIFTNDGGCGTTQGENLLRGYFTIRYRVCVDDSFLPGDTCSGWKNDHN
jgi:hypothetical protein